MKTVFFLGISLLLAQPVQALAIYSSLEELNQSTNRLIVEDWSSYSYLTLLSNKTLNGIVYPGNNRLDEPLVTRCTSPNGIGCISYQVDGGGSRSFGRYPIRFGFESSIEAFSLFITQYTNLRGAGTSEWEIDFNNGQFVNISASWGNQDSIGFGYIGLTGLNDVTSFTIRQTRNDPNVVWSFNHIGYQNSIAVPEPSMALLLITMTLLMSARRKK